MANGNPAGDPEGVFEQMMADMRQEHETWEEGRAEEFVGPPLPEEQAWPEHPGRVNADFIDQMLAKIGFSPDALNDEELFKVMQALDNMKAPTPGGALRPVMSLSEEEAQRAVPIEAAPSLRQLGGAPTGLAVTEEGLVPSEHVTFSEAEAAEAMRIKHRPKSDREKAWEERVKRVRAEAPEEKFKPPDTDPFLKEVRLHAGEWAQYSVRAPEIAGWEGTLRAAAAPPILGEGARGAGGTRYGAQDLFFSKFSQRAAGRFFVSIPMMALGGASGTMGRQVREDSLTEALLMHKVAMEARERGSITFDHVFATSSMDSIINPTPLDPTVGSGPGQEMPVPRTFNTDDFLLDEQSEQDIKTRLDMLQGVYGKWTGLHEEFIQRRLEGYPGLGTNLIKDVTHLFSGLAQLSSQMLGMTVMPSQAKVDDPMDHTILTARMMFSMGEELGPAVIASVAHTLRNPAQNFEARPFTTIIDLMPFYYLAKTGIAAGWLKVSPATSASVDRVIEYGNGIIEHLRAAEYAASEKLDSLLGIPKIEELDILKRRPGKGIVGGEGAQEVVRLPVQDVLSRIKGLGAVWRRNITDITAARSEAGSNLIHETIRVAEQREQAATAAIDYAATEFGRGGIEPGRLTRVMQQEPGPITVSQKYLEEYPSSTASAEEALLAAQSRRAPAHVSKPGERPVVADDPGYVYTHVDASELHNIINSGFKGSSSPRGLRQRVLAEKGPPVEPQAGHAKPPYTPEEFGRINVARARSEASDAVEAANKLEDVPQSVVENYPDIVGAKFTKPGGLPGVGRTAEEVSVGSSEWIVSPSKREVRSARSDWAETWTDSTSALPPPTPGGSHIIRAARERHGPGSTPSDVPTQLDLTGLSPESARVVEAVEKAGVGKPMEGVQPTMALDPELFVASGQANTFRLNKPVRASELEYLGSDGTWYPVATTEMIVQEHGRAGAQAAINSIDRMVDPVTGKSSALGLTLKDSDAGAISVLMAEMTSQGVDTVDAFWMAIERVMAQKLRNPMHPTDPPPVPAVVGGETQMTNLLSPEMEPAVVDVFTERASISLKTGEATLRPISTEQQQMAIKQRLERMSASGHITEDFASSVMDSLVGEGRFKGIENRYTGVTPDSAMPNIQTRVIPRRPEYSSEANMYMERFAGSLAKTPEEARLVRQELDLEISMAAMRNLPEIFRSGTLRPGAAKIAIKNVLPRIMDDPVVGPTKTAAQWERWAFGRGGKERGKGGATASLSSLLERTAGRVGPLSGEPGSVLPLILDIDIPGTNIRINTVDFANVVLNDKTLRGKIVEEAMHQSAIKYGIRKGQEYRQSAFVDKVNEIDEATTAWIRTRAVAEGTFQEGVTGSTKLSTEAEFAEFAANYSIKRGTLPAVLRHNPENLAIHIEKNLSRMADEIVGAERTMLADDATVLVGGKAEWSPGTIRRKTRAAKHKLLGIAREMRLHAELTDVAKKWLRIENTTASKLADKRANGLGHSARDIRKVNIPLKAVDKSIWVGPNVAATFEWEGKVYELMKYGGGLTRAANSTAKSGGTSRNIANLIGNFMSNVLQHTISHGDPTFGAFKLFGLIKDWMSFSTGHLPQGVRKDHFMAGLRTGLLSSDLNTVEAMTAYGHYGLSHWLGGEARWKMPRLAAVIEEAHKRIGMAKHESAWRGTDNIFKLLEMETNWPVVEGWFSKMGEGSTVELAIGRTKTVKVSKKNGSIGVLDDDGKWHALDKLQRENLVAQVSLQPGINKFFNFRDVPMWPKAINVYGGGLAMPYYSWGHLALTRAGLGRPIPGLLTESLFGHPYVRTSDPSILADIAARQAGVMFRLNVMQRMVDSNMFPRGDVLDPEAKAQLAKDSGFNNESRVQLVNLNASHGINVMDVDNWNFAGPVLKAVRALEATWYRGGAIQQAGKIKEALGSDNASQFMQTMLEVRDAGLYGEYSDSGTQLQTGLEAVEVQVHAHKSNAEKLRARGRAPGTRSGLYLAQAAEEEERAIVLEEIAKQTVKIRQMWVVAKAGGTFDTEDFLDVMGASGGFLMDTMTAAREDRLDDPAEIAKTFSKMLLGGTVTRLWRTYLDVDDPTGDWSDRLTWRTEMPAPEKGVVEAVVHSLTSVGWRQVDPYLMASGNLKRARNSFKRGMLKSNDRRFRNIDGHIEKWESQRHIVATQLAKHTSAGTPHPPDLVSDLGMYTDAIKLLNVKRDNLLAWTRTMASETWSPKTKWGEETDPVGKYGEPSLTDMVFDNMVLNAIKKWEESDIELTPETEEMMMNMRHQVEGQ